MVIHVKNKTGIILIILISFLPLNLNGKEITVIHIILLEVKKEGKGSEKGGKGKGKGSERGVKGTIDLAMFSKAEGIVPFTPADASRLTPLSLPFHSLKIK